MASLKTLTQNLSKKIAPLSTPVKSVTGSVASSVGEPALASMVSAAASSRSTAKSVLEKLKSLSNKSTQNIILEDTPISEKLFGSSDNSFWIYFRYGIIIFLLAFLALNVFASLGLLTDNLANFFKPVLVFLGYSVGETIRQTTDVTAEGGKAVIDTTAHTVDSAINILENSIEPEKISTNRALDDAQKKQKQRKRPIKDAPMPDDSGSRVQTKTVNKAGYCYIGEDRGFRSCIKVSDSNDCMSGDIFPSKEICINPNLRV